MRLSGITTYLRRIGIILLGVVYIFSTTAHGFQFFGVDLVYAQGSGNHQDLVAIIVDQGVYGAIQGDLQWYTTTYIPGQADDMQALVIPINTPNFHPKDIQRIIENLYFEGSQNNSSTLKGVILFGDIPLPTVAMDGALLQSIYPYVDLEDPMFVYNERNDTFEFTTRAGSLPELRHSTILTNDVGVFSKFFSKLKEYYADPTSYAKPKIWYDDFPLLKQSYTPQEIDRYVNRLLFADAHEERFVGSTISRLLNRTYEEGLVEVIEQAEQNNEQFQGETFSHESVEGDPTVESAASEIFAGLSTVLDRLDPSQLEQVLIESGEYPIPTKLLETQIQDEYQSTAEVFGATYMETMLENIAAGGRYQLEDIDSSLEKMDLADRVSKAFIRDMNDTLQNGLDAAIDYNEYALKYPLPFRYSMREPWITGGSCGGVFLPDPYDQEFLDRVFEGPQWDRIKSMFAGNIMLEGDFLGLVISGGGKPIAGTQLKQEGATAYEVARVENHYFGKNAADITDYDELTIYRGTYVNQTSQQDIRDLEYETYKDSLDDIPSFDMSKMSMGASLGFSSTQTENNRAFNFNRVTQPRLQGTEFDFQISDKEIYDKWKCDDEQELDEFSYLFWGGASVFNLDGDAMVGNPRFPQTKLDLTDRDQARNPTNNRDIGGWRYDPAGAVLVEEEIDWDSLHVTAHEDRSTPTILRQEDKWDRLERTMLGRYLNINDMKINHCEEREVLESFDEIDYFTIYDGRYPEGPDRVGITVQPTLGYSEDGDSDLIPHIADDDADGDLIPNLEDEEQDGDRIINGEDMNMDGDHELNGLDFDTDGDGIPNSEDPDINNDGELNGEDPDVDQDYLPNGEDVDVDADQVPNSTDPDVDGDGFINEADGDVDGDGLSNDDPNEEDIDGDLIEDSRDRNCNGGGSCNGASTDPDGDGQENGSEQENDNDGDGLENGEDPDIDGDGIPNAYDGDIDGDGLQNPEDPEMDGDMIPNTQDPDIDGDGIPNESDATPNGPEFTASNSTETILSSQACSGANLDIDGDGIENGDDFDIDGDGFHNSVDADMDGDGIPNGEDLDMDCDGKPNESDEDIDCDGISNGGDGDCDGDGIPNESDPDVDGDGLENGDEAENDIDGDGIEDGSDRDVDGDGLANDDSAEQDIDGDGQGDSQDGDIDGDGVVNEQDNDIDGDGVPNNLDPDADGDGVPNQDDGTPGGVPGGDQSGEDQSEDVDDPDLIQLAEQEFFDPGELVSQREDRGDHTCFENGFDYRYQIIDTVVHHRNPFSQEVDLDSTIQTLERPIDDNPYVTFHGIGGDQVTMIYPDLYNIPIYDCNLLDPEDIEQNIKNYLREKVQLYNSYLDRELSNAPSHYATHPAAFDFLETVDKTATPNRSYELLDEDFFVELLGEKNIKRLAHTLHYLSTGWEQKPQAQTIGEFIELSREQFDYNRRMEYIQQEYLTYDEDPFKFDEIVYPTHIEQGYAYEQGFINSDGSDYIGLDDTNATNDTSVSTTPDVGNEFAPGAVIAAQQGRVQDQKCGIPSGEPVPLLKWPKAMQCRFTETLRDPINFSVEIEINYDESFGDSYQGRVSEWFGNVVDTIDTTSENFGGEEDQVRNRIYGFIPKVFGQSSQNTSNPYDPGTIEYDTYRTLDTIYREFDTSEPTTIESQSVQLNVGSVFEDEQSVRMIMSQPASSEVCLSFQGTNLCNSSATVTRSVNQNPIGFEYTFVDNSIGKVDMQLQLCNGSVCVTKDPFVYRGPGILSEVTILIPSEQVAANVPFPMIVQGKDRLGNMTPRSPLPYRVQLANASFSQDQDDTARDLISFEDALYTIYPQSNEAITIQVVPVDDEENLYPIGEKILQVQEIDLQVIFGEGWSEGTYPLPDRDGAFLSVLEDGSTVYNESQLPDILINGLIDGEVVSDTNFPVTITNTSPQLGSLGVVQGDMFERYDVLIDRSRPLQFLPTGQTGIGEFIFQGGSDNQEIRLLYEIKHGALDDLSIELAMENAQIGDEVGGLITLTDSRGNPYSSETTVYLEPTGGFGGTPEAVIVSGGIATFTGEVQSGGGGGCGGGCSGGPPTAADRAAAQSGENESDQNNESENESEEDGSDDEEGSDDGSSTESTQQNDGQVELGGDQQYELYGGGNEVSDSEEGSGGGTTGNEGSDGSDTENGTDGDSQDSDNGESEADVCEPVMPLGYTQDQSVSSSITDQNVSTTTQYELTETLWPSEVEDDLNIMYLHLGASSRGNDLKTTEYLRNSKTLAITTTLDIRGASNPQIFDVSRFEANGKSVPLQKFPQVMKQMHPRGGDITIDLGYQGGIGNYRVGSFASFDFITEGGEYGTAPNKLVYQGEGKFEFGRLTVDDRILVDFVRGEIDEGVAIAMVPSTTDTREIVDESQSYGTFWLYRGVSSPLVESIHLNSDRYTLLEHGQSVVLQTTIPEREYGDPSFEGREGADEPQGNIGWRNEYSAINEFAQGQMMGQATLDYASPYHLNIGDPFLKRISKSRDVVNTDYDEGFGQKVYSSTQPIQDTDLGDIDGDGLTDMIITSSNGTIKLLYNEGGSHPYSDWGSMIALADGIKETWVGDANGDGGDDIIVRTLADTLRVYLNRAGKIDVNGTPVCLDIPFGERNVAQANQMFVEDMDGNGTVDIITYDTEGDIKAFYGGGNSYLSTDPMRCDPDWRSRQNMQLIKSFGTILESVPIRDETLRHREGLEVTPVPEHSQEFEGGGGEEGDAPNMKKWSKAEIEAYTQGVMAESIENAKNNADPELLFSQIDDMIDHVIEVPAAMRKYPDRNLQNYGAIRAIDPYPDTPRIDVEKTYIDLDGAPLRKGDLVRVNVSVIPVGFSGPASIWDRIPGSWIVYKTDFNEIASFHPGGLQSGYEIDRNVGNGYEYRLDIPSVGGGATYSYELQYDGDGYMRLELETQLDDLFVGSNVTSVGEEVYAQGGRQHRLRAYPEDGCYNEFYEFSPGERRIDRTNFLEEESLKYDGFVEDQRDEAESIATKPTHVSPIEDLLGVPSDWANIPKDQWEKIKIGALLSGIAGGGGGGFEIDAASWLESWGDAQRKELQKKFKEDILDLDRANPLKRLGVGTDHTLSKAACGGGSFGTKTCGGGRPIPFNNDLLSPGSFHIMGCKPPGGGNPFFPDFDGVPIFAVPTAAPIPVWPPIPTGAGGIPPFAGKTSQFRTYLTRTTSNGVGMSLCFGPYGITNFLPTPLGDVAGNCLVFASRLGPRCDGENPDGREATVLPYTTANEVDSAQVLEEGHRDLHEIGVCDDRARSMSPLSSTVLGGRVATHGSISSVNYRKAQEEQDYLLGGNELELQIEGGSVKGLVQCLVRKRVENQSAYIANNALHMQITLILPNIDTLRENFEDVGVLADRQQLHLGRQSHDQAQNESDGLADKSVQEGGGDENERFSLSRAFDNTLNSISGNPFDKVAQFFDDVPLVSFEEKTVPIEVPFVYVDDLKRYGYYLQGWLQRNRETLNDRGQVENYAQVSDAVSEMQATYSTVQRNLQTLKQYERLPIDLYQLLHASDQYISETIGFVESLLGYITGRLQDNARRFSMRVDVIITLKGIVETWQILIDFSVQWQSKCAKCRQDNYDFYSCKLKLLCVDLPILPIPPFHLPDIIIDLSKINLGIEIALPRFNFVPRKVTLPQLPDLPSPIDVNVDIRVPEIPVLPPPPPLPQLPTFKLKADVELPSLPPPPKIPEISPAIEAVINIADLIGTFMCIFKGGIGLVSEENIKARVEQLTQRSQDVFPFDSLEIKIPQTPVEAYDYKIDAVVDFKADFRQLYDIVDDISLERSMFLDKQEQEIRQTIFSQDIQDSAVGQAILNGDTGLGNGINVEVDLQGNTLSPDDLSALLASKRSLDHFGGEAVDVKKHLLSGLKTILDDSRLTYLHDQANDVSTLLSLERRITPNIQGISDDFANATIWLQGIQKQVQKEKELIKDYDAFIDSLGTYSLVSTTKDDAFEVASALYLTDETTRREISNQQSPMHSYLSLNDQILSGYERALSTHSPDELRMNSVQHRYLSHQVNQLRNSIANKLGGPLLAQRRTMEGEQPIPPSPTRSMESPSTLIDMTQFIKGFFVLADDGKYRNVVRWEDQAQQRHDNQQFETQDVNNDGTVDIVFWTDYQVMIKYGKQNNGSVRKPGGVGSFIVLGPFDSPQSIAELTLEQGGWYEGRKIRDVFSVVDSFQRQGQNYSSMAWTWDTDPLREGYLIEVTEKLSTSQSRGWGSHRIDDPARTRYVLLVPRDRVLMYTDTLYVWDRDQEYRINQLVDQGRIIEIVRYDGSSDDAMAVLANQAERWYYGRHTILRRKRISINSSLSYDRYEKIAPWGQTHIVGAQIRGDDELPQPTVRLVRDITGETVSEGFALQGNINTTYTLEVEWEDNGVVLHNWIVVDDEVIVFESGETSQVGGIDYNHEREDRLTLVAVDQAGNVVEQDISLQIGIPSLSLEDIEYGEDTARIISQLSETIDRGQIKFQRNRYGYREPLDPEEFAVQPLDPVVVGQTYDMNDGLSLGSDEDEQEDQEDENSQDDQNNTQDDSEQESGESQNDENESEESQNNQSDDSNSDDSQNQLPSSMPVSCSGGSPQAQVQDSEGNTYGLEFEPDTGDSIAPPQPGTGYEVVPLGSAEELGIYADGRCVRQVGMQTCIMYISPYGHTLIEEPYRYWMQGTISLDEPNLTATVILTENQETVVEFSFVYMPF